jgi:hypothetical protein
LARGVTSKHMVLEFAFAGFPTTLIKITSIL